MPKSGIKKNDKLLARVNQELYKRNAELAVRNKTLALLRALDEISLSTLGVKQLSEKMSAAIAAELGYDIAGIAVLDSTSKTISWLGLSSAVTWIVAVLNKLNHHAHAPINLAESPALAAAFENHHAHYSDQPSQIYPAEFLDALSAADQTPDVAEVKYTALFPLRFNEKPLGLLALSASHSFEKASRYERESFTGIVSIVALAVYNAKTYENLQQTSAQLRRANEELKTIDNAKSEFLSIASHQLYTPLTALNGYLSMIEEGDYGAVPAKLSPIIDILSQSSNRLITLVKGLLDISRIESGRLELELESLNLAELAKELVQDLLPNAVNKKLDLEFHEPEQSLPNVVADRERIRQVMLNYIDNAIKYTSAGRIDVKLTFTDTSVIFSVTDTGRGLDDQQIRKLFRKFSRVKGAERVYTEGAGLGLYVAKQIVEEHRGQVGVVSPGVDRGSTFTMELPIEGTPSSLIAGQEASVIIKAGKHESTQTDK